MNHSEFLNVIADVVDTGMTHVVSFELRKLNPKDKTELSMYLRDLAVQSKKTK